MLLWLSRGTWTHCKHFPIPGGPTCGFKGLSPAKPRNLATVLLDVYMSAAPHWGRATESTQQDFHTQRKRQNGGIWFQCTSLQSLASNIFWKEVPVYRQPKQKRRPAAAFGGNVEFTHSWSQARIKCKCMWEGQRRRVGIQRLNVYRTSDRTRRPPLTHQQYGHKTCRSQNKSVLSILNLENLLLISVPGTWSTTAPHAFPSNH